MKSGTKENKRRGRPLKTPSEPKTEGQRLMIDVPGIDSDVAKKLGCGLAAVGHWRNGRRIPGGSSRRKLDLLFGIPQRAWDVEPGTTLSRPDPSRPAQAKEKAKAKAKAKAKGGQKDSNTMETTQDQIDAILLKLKEEKLTDSVEARLRDTLMKTLGLMARLERDQALLEDRVIRGHPEWLRIKAAILKALKGYPDAARAVIEALR